MLLKKGHLPGRLRKLLVSRFLFALSRRTHSNGML